MPDTYSPSDIPTFLTGGNAEFIAGLYQRYQNDPNSVDPSWRGFFGTLGDGARDILDEMSGASWTRQDHLDLRHDDPIVRSFEEGGNGVVMPQAPQLNAGFTPQAAQLIASGAKPALSNDEIRTALMDSIRALMMIRVYRVRGHLEATLDPLGLENRDHHPELDPRNYGFTDADYDRPIFIDNVLGLEYATLREIMALVRETYCGHIGVEFMHIQEPDQKAWIQERIESIHNVTNFTERGKLAILERLTAAETFEQFLHRKYTGTKRFGLDGGEAMVPAIEQIMKRGGQMGLKEMVLGMSHRGRLNVLANVMGKPFRAIFSEFHGGAANPEDIQGSGDVKYHLGTSTDRDFDGNVVHLSLTANPSHLEAVNPVVLGKVRAKQKQIQDDDRTRVMGLLLHGDAAFAGQGLVAETLALSELRGYRTGGTIHVVINNQIGFTTSPRDARSGPYSTDVAMMIQAPIFHVNGDDPQAVVHVARICTEFRQTFKKDVVIDMFCYRRYGHNEGDEPSFTQPVMYRAIGDHPSTRALYARQLEDEGLIKAGEADDLVEKSYAHLESEYSAAEGYRPNKADWLEGRWTGISTAHPGDRRGATGISTDILREIGEKLTTVPDDFNVHSKIKRQLNAKRKMFESGKGFDWATAEAMAFATLAREGAFVRLSGQDCGRGTFSQRHAILYDQEDGHTYMPLQNISEGQGVVEVLDSPLSEAAVMGFEYGYSMAEPNGLIMWEGQFGDFANGAQVIIDQFITSGEAKWLRMSGLTLLLPHGYEGQGPEHSSARLERFLQMCGEDNIQVVNCTTPANYFHVLRRQVRRDFRKPLVIMTPKSLLRHKLCVSSIEMFAEDQTFHRVLYEDNVSLVEPEKIRRVVLCSGKVYYDLRQAREDKEVDDVAILRLEQIYPFPYNALAEEMGKYPNADIVWCQEEPANMGAWSFVEHRIDEVQKQLGHSRGGPKYAGRPESAATATGLLKRHMAEQAALTSDALGAG